MACSQDRHQDGMSVRRISYKNRVALAAAGLGSRAAGGAASFLMRERRGSRGAGLRWAEYAGCWA